MNIVPALCAPVARSTACTIALATALALPAGAQDPVVKPTATTAVTHTRLPAPAKITAAQQSDGRIYVHWSPVDGVARYLLYRSVPNSTQGYVALPHPADTIYWDSDVQKGLYYYYVVQALNQAGDAGLKVAAQPVIASTAATTTVTGTPGTGTTGTGTAGTGAIAPPSRVWAHVRYYPQVQLDVRTTQAGVLCQAERGVITATGTTFTLLPAAPRPCGYVISDPTNIDKYPVGTRLVYRVTAVDSAPSGLKSAPTLSNEVVTYKLSAAVSYSLELVLQPGSGAVANVYQGTPGTDLTNRRVASLDPTIASVTPDGNVYLHAVGSTYIVLFGSWASGGLQGQLTAYLIRVDVLPPSS